MSRIHALRPLLPLAAALALAACGGGNGGSTASTDTTPSLGLIRNADVNFYRADDPACPASCELLASSNTGATGVISARISDYSGPMVIEVIGNASAEYFDEQTNQFEPFGATNVLHAITPSSRGRFGVTVLTELAYQRAVVEGRFPLTGPIVTAINNEIGAALAPEITGGILTPPGLITDTSAAGSLLNNTPNLYALKLAAFAALGDGGTPTPALAVLNALIEDIQDGTIDGLNDGAALVPAAPYNPATFAADLQAAMEGFASTYANADLEARVGNLPGTLTLTLFDNPNNGGGDDGGSGTLGDNSGVTGSFGGIVRTSTDITDFRGPPLSVAQGILDVGGPLDPFSVNLRQFNTSSGSIGVPQNCASNGVPSLFVVIDGVFYNGTPSEESTASCSVTVTQISDTAIRGTFSGTLTAAGQPDLVVTNGAFQYLIEPFAAGNGSAQVTASFEGLNTGALDGQGNGNGDTGWQGEWTDSALVASVVDVSAGALTFTPASGTELSGQNQAIQLSSFGSYSLDGRRLANAFADDVYVAALLRVADASQPSRSRITLGNPGVYIGLDSNDGSNQFIASLADSESNRARTGGTLNSNTTYLIVARLYKNQISDDDYNRLALWVNPGVNDSGSPDATAARTRGTGSVLALDRIGIAGDSQFSNLQIDRIRLSDSWEGIFAEDDIEEPSELQLLIDYAGTYEVACTAVEPSARGTATRDHVRGTVIIGGDGSIDFDSGAEFSFTAGDIGALFDRTMLEGDIRRVVVNYDEDDSGRQITLYLNDALAVTEIRYQDGLGGITRAAIGGTENCAGGGGDDGLGENSGASAALDGVVATHTGYISSSTISGTFNFIAKDANNGTAPGWNVQGRLQAGDQACDDNVVFLGRYQDSNIFFATSCTINVSTIPADVFSTNATIEGTFSGTFNIGGETVTVTNGVFRNVAP